MYVYMILTLFSRYILFNTYKLDLIPMTCASCFPSLIPPIIPRACIDSPPLLVLLRFEHRFAIFVLYITKIKKLNYPLKYI